MLPRIGPCIVWVLTSTACFVDAVGQAPGEGGDTNAGGQAQGAGGEGAGFAGGTTNDGGAGAGGTPSTGGAEPVQCDQGQTCSPAISGGDVVVMTSGDQDCPAGYSTKLLVGDGSDPGCASCSCTMSTANTSCTPGNEARYWDGGCNNFAGNMDLSDENCHFLPGGNGQTDGHRLMPSTPSAGVCDVASPSAPLPIVVSTACKLDASFSGACEGGGRCLPPTAPPFERVCNLLPVGDTSCEPGWNEAGSVRELIDDTRSCNCDCSVETPPRCDGATLQVFDGSSCGGSAVATYPADGQCHDASALSQSDSVRAEGGTWMAGACSGEGVVDGLASWGPARTVCCLP